MGMLVTAPRPRARKFLQGTALHKSYYYYDDDQGDYGLGRRCHPPRRSSLCSAECASWSSLMMKLHLSRSSSHSNVLPVLPVKAGKVE